jgi:hypothetical protein
VCYPELTRTAWLIASVRRTTAATLLLAAELDLVLWAWKEWVGFPYGKEEKTKAEGL